MTIDEIRSLIDNEVPENRSLEYKREIHLDNSSQKKKFLCNVTAFANTVGGVILVGVSEENGLPKDIVGMRSDAVDALKSAMENVVSQSVAPRLSGLDIDSIPVGDGLAVMVISIPASINGPHMVSHEKSRLFYKRHSAGKIEMDIYDLRSAFARTGSQIELASEWIRSRIESYSERKAGISQGDTSYLALHVCPVGGAMARNRVTVKDIIGTHNHWADMRTLAGPAHGKSVDVDGLSVLETDNREYPRSRATYFRNGYVESVTSMSAIAHGEPRRISAFEFEVRVKQLFDDVWSNLNRLGFYFPVVLGGGFVRCAQMKLSVSGFLTAESSIPLSGAMVVLPEVVIESGNDMNWNDLQPYFDSIWNAFGMTRSFHYNDRGERSDDKHLRNAYRMGG